MYLQTFKKNVQTKLRKQVPRFIIGEPTYKRINETNCIIRAVVSHKYH
jgi:hypothetical protein